MKQARVADTVPMPDDLRVLREAPANDEYVTLYETQSGLWCAQFWMRVNGQSIADYTEERVAKSQALRDAFELAAEEDVPFVDMVETEQEPLYVESTVESDEPDPLNIDSTVVGE